ncbi:MAG: DUF523 and DUF1722 domain-containing protein [Bryobacterales bacterium]
MDGKRPQTTPLRIGVSACLMGETVRFNGGHCANRFLLREAAEFAEFVPVCPEVEIGLGTPRETLRLVRLGEAVHLVAPSSGADVTEKMRQYAREKAESLAAANLDAFVLKKDSPSCGMERVKVYDGNGVPSKSGVGLFAEALIERLPLLPVEEEGRLNDPHLRESFFERAFAYRRVRDLFASSWTVADLVAFHTSEKLLLLSHDPNRFRETGRLVASAGAMDRDQLAAEYTTHFMQTLARPASVSRQTAVLERILGYCKAKLTAAEKRDALESVSDFRAGLVPLVAPLTLLRHYVRRFGVSYIASQTYLEPHPKQLMLRSRV